MNLENVLPMDIEKRSFEIITEELGELKLDPDNASTPQRILIMPAPCGSVTMWLRTRWPL